MQGLHSKVDLLGTVKLAKVGHAHIRRGEGAVGVGDRLPERLEREHLLLLHLGHDAALRVGTHRLEALDREGIRPQDLDGASGRLVECVHAAHLAELDVVAVLEPVPRVVQARHHRRKGRVVHGRDHRRDRLLSIDVHADELVAKVAEGVSEDAKRLKRETAASRGGQRGESKGGGRVWWRGE